MSSAVSPRMDEFGAAALGLDRRLIAGEALGIVATLQDAGYDGYLVGGCVRDLLLKRRPKDFDIVTDASPENIRRLFRRSRIIGRRFRLVHVRAGRQLYEVSTYRARPAGSGSKWSGWWRKLKHTRPVHDDNLFGSLEEDAERRDFTINALYYDPERDCVLDRVGGLKDIERRRLRVIGEPEERFREDPMRILRVVRFAAKLELEIDRPLGQLIRRHRHLLNQVPDARRYDEFLKLFQHGHAAASWALLDRYELLPGLFESGLLPAITARQNLIDRALENTDRRVSRDMPVTEGFLFAALFWPVRAANLVRLRKPAPRDVDAAGRKVFAAQAKQMPIPRRASDVAREIWSLQALLERCRPSSTERLARQRWFRAAYDFLLLRAELGELDSSIVDWWRPKAKTVQRYSSPHRGEHSAGRSSGRSSGRPSGRPPRRRRSRPAPRRSVSPA